MRAPRHGCQQVSLSVSPGMPMCHQYGHLKCRRDPLTLDFRLHALPQRLFKVPVGVQCCVLGTKSQSGGPAPGPQQPDRRCSRKKRRIIENISFSWARATFGNSWGAFGNLGVGISYTKRTVLKERQLECHDDGNNEINKTLACIGPNGLSEYFSKVLVSEKCTGPKREANPLRK